MRQPVRFVVLALIGAAGMSAMVGADEINTPAPTSSLAPYDEFIGEDEPAFSLVHIVHRRNFRSAALLDRDRDGYAEIMFAAPGSATLVDNLGGGTFSMVGSVASYSGTGFGAHDFDHDGVLDLHLSLADYDDAIIVQANGRLKFTNIGTEVENAVVRTALFDDFDGDGHVDSFLSTSFFRTKHQWPLFLHGLEGGGFSENMIDSILSPSIPGFWYDRTPLELPEDEEECADELWAVKQFKGGLVRDFDLDGQPDIVSSVYADTGFRDERCEGFSWAWANAMERGLFYFHNIGEPGLPAFEEIGLEVFGEFAHGNTSEFWNPYQATTLDYDRDGDLDLFVGAFLRPHYDGPEDTVAVRFLENNGGQFIDRTVEAGFDWLNQLDPVERAERTFAAGAPVDYDNDGWVDLVFVNRAKPGDRYRNVHVFKNNGQRAFELIPPEVHGMGHGNGRDLTYGDLNLDGFVDIVVADGAGGGTVGANDAKIYFNTLSNNGNDWIAVNVLTDSGTAAIGSKVSLYDSETDELLGYEEVRTDFSYRSKKLPVLYFGLGETDEVDITITSRYGVTADCRGLDSNRYYDLSFPRTRPLEESTGLQIRPQLPERPVVASEVRSRQGITRKLCKERRD